MPTPQDLLDDLHSIKIHNAWAPGISKKEREALIKTKRARLKVAKQLIRQEQEAIKKRYDGRNKLEAAIEQEKLTPYRLFDQLVAEIEAAFTDLQHANEFDRSMPDVPTFGQIFYGNPEYGGYWIAGPSDLKRIQQELLEKGKAIKDEIKSIKDQQEVIRRAQPEEAFIKSTFAARNTQTLFAAFLSLAVFCELMAMIVFIGQSGALQILGAVVFITVVLLLIVHASIRQLNRKFLHPYIAALTEITKLDIEIGKNEALYNQVKGFYDDAKAGLMRIAERGELYS